MRFLKDERGSQTLEFMGVLPLFFLMVLLIWQSAITVHTKIVAEAAAMDGARAAIVDGDYNTAVRKVANPHEVKSVTKTEASGYVTVRVTLKSPLMHNVEFFNTAGLELPVSAEVTMKKEN